MHSSILRTMVTRGPQGRIHKGISQFFNEADQNDYSVELIGNEVLRLWALWK